MGIIDLGTQRLDIGGGAKGFTPIEFDDGKAYLVKGQFTVSEFNNIFSYIRVRAFLSISGQPPYWAASFVELDIVQEPFSFFYPFSSLYDGGGDARFFAERIPRAPGAGELGTVVDLNLFYDDGIETSTWFN